MAAIEREFKAGETIFKDEDKSTSMYLLVSGAVSIQKQKQGTPIDLAKIMPGEIFGEVGFFDGKERSASAVAITTVKLQEISYASLREVYDKVPSYFRVMVAALAERLRRADDTIKRLQKVQ